MFLEVVLRDLRINIFRISLRHELLDRHKFAIKCVSMPNTYIGRCREYVH